MINIEDGDSASEANRTGRASEMLHVSTSGGASLELPEGKAFPGVAAKFDL